MESPGEWLKNALFDLCLDKEISSGLVSCRDLADPRDAKDRVP